MAKPKMPTCHSSVIGFLLVYFDQNMSNEMYEELEVVTIA